ncbi:MAG: hypothetical protein K6F69_03765 [Treponema sp.]|nr:hypothetical protein [Treponema sp.]
MTETTVLSVDIGTSSLKASISGVFSHSGIIVMASSRIRFPKIETENKYKEATFWLPALKEALKDIKNKCEALEQNPFESLAGICISGNGPTIVSKDGTTLLWNTPITIDIPKDCESLFIPRLMQFKYQFKEKWKNSDTIFSGPEYLIWQLTGKAFTILPEARYTKAYWTTESLYKFGFDAQEQSKLPTYLGLGDCAGTIKEDISKAFDGIIPKGLPVFCGGPDFIVALIGTATITPGKLCDCAGSSEGINLCTSRPLSGEGIRTLPSAIPGLWNAAVLIPESGIRFSNLKEEIEAKINKKMDYEEFVSYILDEKDEKGMELMTEIAINTKKALKTLFDAAKEAGLPVDNKMQITGGQAKNKIWLTMKCNITATTLTVPSFPDAELTGDAILARVGLGEYESIEQACNIMVQTNKTYRPA